VENQMFMVGTNMKKMYAELVQDLLPPPDEPTFDCPIHWKCDCKESENPTQGRSGCYVTVKGAKCEGVEAAGDCFNPLSSQCICCLLYMCWFYLNELGMCCHFLRR
jgi:hypothetical protein